MTDIIFCSIWVQISCKPVMNVVDCIIKCDLYSQKINIYSKNTHGMSNKKNPKKTHNMAKACIFCYISIITGNVYIKLMAIERGTNTTRKGNHQSVFDSLVPFLLKFFSIKSVCCE